LPDLRSPFALVVLFADRDARLDLAVESLLFGDHARSVAAFDDLVTHQVVGESIQIRPRDKGKTQRANDCAPPNLLKPRAVSRRENIGDLPPASDEPIRALAST